LYRLDIHSLPFLGIIRGWSKDSCALSFDDGPDRGEIELISTLNSGGMQATFFWIPEKVVNFYHTLPKDFQELLILLKKGGHEVGIHGFFCAMPNIYQRIFRPISADKVGEAQRYFFTFLGYTPHLYRPHFIQYYKKPDKIDTILGYHQIGPRDKTDKYLKVAENMLAGDMICGHSSMNCDLDFGKASEIAKIVLQLKTIFEKKNLKVTVISEIIKQNKASVKNS
jgi:peptidoglycan/xylan/chitin deacetylase (PgdA/CDA1 family)